MLWRADWRETSLQKPIRNPVCNEQMPCLGGMPGPVPMQGLSGECERWLVEGSRWVELACKPLDTGGPLCMGIDTPIL